MRLLTEEEVSESYETNTGRVIVEYLKINVKDVMAVPSILCAGHGVFTWGNSAIEAVNNAVVVEEIAKMAYITELLNNHVYELPKFIQDKHYYRKHGKNAYYGQMHS